MSLSAMTFDEHYGHLPKSTHRLIRRYNVSPADYDEILSLLGHSWEDPDIPWEAVSAIIENGSRERGYYSRNRKF